MKCFIINHDWSIWRGTMSGTERIQFRICKKCGVIKTTEAMHGVQFVPLQDIKKLTDDYFPKEKGEK